jgi:isoleucyl-tRNA synthetase
LIIEGIVELDVATKPSLMDPNPAPQFEQVPDDFDTASSELSIIDQYKKQCIGLKVVYRNKGAPLFNFIDGPPFATGVPHCGHYLQSFGKSTVTNFMRMNGYYVEDQFGFDVHGLPSETNAMKELGLKTTADIRAMGKAKFNQVCHQMTDKCSAAFPQMFERIGRFVDHKNNYTTKDLPFMESVWAVFKALHEKDLVYRGLKIMPYCPTCTTSLSNFEAGENYKEVDTLAIFVKFKIRELDQYLVAWTTTPWTLPSNLALCVNKDIKYVELMDKKTGETYVMAQDTVKNLYPENKKMVAKDMYEIKKVFDGKDLVGLEYEPMFETYGGRKFCVINGDFVDATSGTGIVHIAPCYGPDDFNVCIREKVCTVEQVREFKTLDDHCKFNGLLPQYQGLYYADANTVIAKDLEKRHIVIKKNTIKHNCAHCPRTDDALVFMPVDSFFVRVTAIKDQLIENNKKVNWIPEHIGSGRMHQWLENVKDWGVSRSRFYGTPIPVWMDDDGAMICVGSVAELRALSGCGELKDIHPENVDDITIVGANGKVLRRVPDVFDCWFESGAVPVAKDHYPFENKEKYDGKEFMCDFICEGLDQTRGWFYTLMVLSTALFNKPAFKNVICSGLILAKDGRKFAKRWKNGVDMEKILSTYGSDALRVYLISSPATHAQSFKFDEEAIDSYIGKKLFQWFNAFKFFLEHSIKYMKDGNKFEVDVKSTNIMDRWILARVRSTLVVFSDAVNKFQLYWVGPEIQRFIEDLINWYIKFNRGRLKGRNCSREEHMQSLATLYRVLLNFAIMMAPFTPFMSELMYQRLRVVLKGTPESVLLCDYPKANDFVDDPVIEAKIRLLQQVSGMVRSLRTGTKESQSAKVPIELVTVCSDDDSVISTIKEFERYFVEQINCLNIAYRGLAGLVKYRVVPNVRSLGQKYRGNAAGIRSSLEALDSKVVESIKESIVVGEHTVSREHFDVAVDMDTKLGTHELAKVEDTVAVVINFEHTVTVRETYFVRMFIKTVQDMRKGTKLRPWNAINIYYEVADNSVLVRYNDKIVEELLYNIYPMVESVGDEGVVVIEKETEICGVPMKLKITLKN